jgi:hypothetical protein
MTTMTQLRSASSQGVVQVTGPSEERSVVSHLAGRLIQITLALYLLPALLIVVVVGGVGILVLMVSQLFTSRRAAE